MTTFERLEALLYLRREAPNEHTVSALSHHVGIAPELLLETLTGLAASGLATPGSAESAFRFAPATPELAEAVESLAAAYQERSAAVLSAMSVYAIERIRSGPIRAFADSFVLGKRKGDG